jgi:hypothetical protein
MAAVGSSRGNDGGDAGADRWTKETERGTAVFAALANALQRVPPLLALVPAVAPSDRGRGGNEARDGGEGSDAVNVVVLHGEASTAGAVSPAVARSLLRLHLTAASSALAQLQDIMYVAAAHRTAAEQSSDWRIFVYFFAALMGS